MKTRGFTLLEVLMALVIFGIAAAVLGGAYINVLNSYQVAARGTQMNEDFAYARQVVLQEADRKKLEQGGEFTTADGRVARWSVEITQANVADLFNVAFTCELPPPNDAAGNKPAAEKVEQSFVLLRPTWSIDAAERGKLKEESKARILEMQGKKQ